MIHRRLIAIPALAVMLAIGASAAGAQDSTEQDTTEERLKLAREHVELFVVDQMIGDMVPVMTRQIAQSLRASQPDKPDAEIDAVADRLAKLMAERMSADLPALTADLMANHFTVGEIEALTTFYSTPDGRSIVGKMGSYNADVLQAVTPYVQRIAPEVAQQAIQELLSEGVISGGN